VEVEESSIDTMDDGAVAHYEGLLLSTTHRFSHNFTGVANFTDSYCLSDYDFGAALAGAQNSQPFNRHADWGPCISDTRYNFNLSWRRRVPGRVTIRGWAACLAGGNWRL
jgi:hypothetical protein